MAEPRWIRFEVMPLTANRKTRTWKVLAKQDGSLVGLVSWHAPWRRYCFIVQAYMPSASVFDDQCLRDIAAFVESRTRQHRRQRDTGPAAQPA
jgi:hypothetical protein